ncbi:hypothetical protein [Marinobacter litoralis]|uniref:hypothetical protein n=1 Tax=Marinobacter litoralis TaxID=187981 RepID=UPI0018EA8B8C|nr:hypothetical protein [Marinobacter litoralis]MBJ6137910.1 hypothetical protein [Marinobacter litoralis]
MERLSKFGTIISKVGEKYIREMDLLPKPTAGKIPVLITVGSQQTPQWGTQQAQIFQVQSANIQLHHWPRNGTGGHIPTNLCQYL